MRDFRDAKAMAHTLRAALAAKGLNITVSQSLELIAQAFGVADWNTLAAAIRRETRASPPQPPDETAPPRFSAELRSTLNRALDCAGQQKHEYMTLEHLLLALIDDLNASGVMKASDVDLAALRENVASYIDNDLKTLVIEDSRKPRPTPAFQRVVQRAVLHAQGLGRRTATGGDLLVAIFDETESPAVWLLGEQQMTQQDAVNFIYHGSVIDSSDTEG
jgi:Glyoxalase superfamily protein/Clp amino terminal domain, pathogenicity island component